MKHLVWLLLTVFCTALAQVQPVTPLQQSEACSCCGEGVSACGMPDCAPAPTTTPVSFVLSAPSTSLRAEAQRVAVEPKTSDEPFYFRFVDARLTSRVAMSDVRASLAGVPLYKAHCSLLI